MAHPSECIEISKRMVSQLRWTIARPVSGVETGVWQVQIQAKLVGAGRMELPTPCLSCWHRVGVTARLQHGTCPPLLSNRNGNSGTRSDTRRAYRQHLRRGAGERAAHYLGIIPIAQCNWGISARLCPREWRGNSRWVSSRFILFAALLPHVLDDPYSLALGQLLH